MAKIGVYQAKTTTTMTTMTLFRHRTFKNIPFQSISNFFFVFRSNDSPPMPEDVELSDDSDPPPPPEPQDTSPTVPAAPKVIFYILFG